MELLSAEPPVPIKLLSSRASTLHLARVVNSCGDVGSATAAKQTSVEFVRHSNWATLQCALTKRPDLIVAMQRLAAHSWREKLLLTEAAVKQVRVYLYDPSFTAEAIATIHPGGVTARRLLVFVQSVAAVQRLIPHFAKLEERCACPNIEDVFAIGRDDDDDDDGDRRDGF